MGFTCLNHSEMGAGGTVSMTEMNYRAAESAGQDHTARMCILILLYTFRKTNARLHTT